MIPSFFKKLCFSFLVLFVFIYPQVAFCFDEKTHKYEISDSKHNKIVFESKKNDLGMEEGIHGELSIYNKNNELIYFEKYVSEASCFGTEYASPLLLENNTRFKREIIILCGDEGGGGNHHVLTFIENGKLLGRLQAGANEFPKVTWDNPTKQYQVITAERLGSQYNGLDSFFYVYAWNGSSQEWFHVIFNITSKKLYWENYIESKKFLIGRIKKNIGRKNSQIWKMVLPDATLASLIATSDSNLICSELAKLPFSQFPKESIQKTILFNEQYGYPSFQISNCKGK